MPLCQIHTFRWIPKNDRSYCCLSRVRQADTAIVFVHGFLGNGIDTWQHFPALVDELSEGVAWWANADLYFWTYPSAEQTVNQSAFQLREFLVQILPVPSTQLFALAGAPVPTDQEYLRQPAEYRHLVLVGHSQGGVVIRQLVVDTIKQWEFDGTPALSQQDQSTFTGLIVNGEVHLFSPPLHGATFSGLPAIIYEIPVTRWLFEVMLKAYSPSYGQLKSESAPLKALEEATSRFYSLYKFPALSARIYYAENDQVVSDVVYGVDPPATYIPQQTHASVCKPRPGYFRPLELIQHATSRRLSAA